jgi:signal transduction histidine kinase
MDFFLFSALLNVVTSGLVCLFVIFNNPKTKTNRYFTFYALSIAMWAIFQLSWISAIYKSDALLYMQIALTFALFIPPTFFHFTCHLVNDYKKHAQIVFYSYIFSLAMIPIVYTPLFIIDVQKISMIRNWPVAGNLFILLVLEYLTLIAYALFIIYKKLKTTTGPQHQQLRYIFWGILIAYIGGSTNFFLCYHIFIPPYGNILIPIYSIFITYAIFKYQLMDINIIIKRSLVYSILITILTIFYFLSIYITEHIFQVMFGYKSFLFSLASATVIALAFIPLRNVIQTFVEKILFRGNYMQITKENELLRQEVIQVERLKAVATLASGMAHEIKNPLTVLKTFSEFLPAKINDQAFLEKFGPMISQEINRIDNLVHELLDFARPANPILKPVNIHYLLDSTLELLSNDYIKYNIKTHRNFHLSTDTILYLDYNQIKQALLNILLNAIDAMQNGGQLYVSIGLGSNGEMIQIKIQDTGAGINAEDLPHIFDPFFSKKDTGTGLGLSITYEIIKKHGGKIFVESVEGKGTTFILELPILTTPPS